MLADVGSRRRRAERHPARTRRDARVVGHWSPNYLTLEAAGRAAARDKKRSAESALEEDSARRGKQQLPLDEN